ncbi:FG-GAP-like repeat-containing protein [Lacibacter sp.]|uniref:FG-GAP-like repeat-containing protein n=1 Tax=Lacibacter sp. TaxID=1915409 RepID=UPI002B4B113E|nr:FG-GAP-like repeat-containing protein [Lacibacter sp.]HLP38352.1 FG-GAP-like repeat-containing protein [Lacibacter sp.]
MIQQSLSCKSVLLKISGLCLLTLLLSLNALAQPAISSFNPTSAPVGASVTITGSGFSTTAASNSVFFGVVKATVTAASATSLTVTVPAGATYQPITVTVNNLTAYSGRFFTVTFNGAASAFSSKSFEYAARIDSVDANIETTKYTIADIDNDDKIDVITIDRFNNTMSVYRNTSTGGNISFATKNDFTTGQSPRSVSVGDIDGDGKLDIVVSNFVSNTVSVFKNISTSGNISFAPKIDFTTATQPAAISITDLDKDGKSDLIINTVNLDGYVSLLRNTSSSGTISFAPKTDLQAAGGSIEELRTTDVDGDGKFDIILPNFSLHAITIFRNTSTTGNLSFAPLVNISTFTNPDEIEIGDLNNDGKSDIVVGHYADARVLILRNTSSVGAITFQNDGSHSDGLAPRGMAINDLDGDGKPDLVVNTGVLSFSLFKNTSSAGGTVLFNAGVKTLTGYNSKVISANFDGDDKPDLAFEAGMFRVSVWKNRTSSPQIFSFSPLSPAIKGTVITINGVNFSGVNAVSFGGIPASSFTVVNTTTITAVVDTGATGDIVVTTPVDSARIPGFMFIAPPIITSFSPTTGTLGTNVTITGFNFTNTGNISFGGVPADSFRVTSPTTIIATVLGGASGYVSVTNPDGSDSLAGFTYLPPPLPGIIAVSPNKATVGTVITITGNHFSTDTALNYVYFGPVRAKVLAASANTLTVQLPPGAGYGPVSITTNSLTAFSPNAFIPIFPNGGNISSGSFSDHIALETGASPQDVCMTDFDGDGKNDLAVVQATRSGISLLRNKSDSVNISFHSQVDIAGFSPYGLIESVEMDGDGKKDIVATGSYSNTLSVFKNTSVKGTIDFSERKDYYLADFPSNVRAFTTADMDGDGKQDILITGYKTVSIIRNTSFLNRISLAPMISINVGEHNATIKAGDVDADGKPDIVLINATTDSVTVLRNISNRGNLLFESPVNFAIMDDRTDYYGSSNLCLSDLDNDGKIDIAVSNTASSFSISVLKNYSTAGNILFRLANNRKTGYFHPVVLTPEDLDGDGQPDIAFNNGNPLRAIGTLRNNSTADSVSLASPFTYLYNNSGSPAGLCTGDLNNDGRPEIICAGGTFSSPGNIYIFKNKTNGPHLTSFSPGNGIIDSVITLTGSNFTGTTVVSFGGMPAKSFSVLSPSTISAVVSTGSSGNVTVTNPLGNSSLPGFLYGLPPVITSFSPDSGGQNTSVNIKGKNLRWVTGVKFGGEPAISVTVNSDTSITAIVGFGASGAVTVIGNVDSASLQGFAYIPPPVIDSFSPTSGTTGTKVSIYGSNFATAKAVYFENVPAQSFTVISPSLIEAVVGLGATGQVVVETAGGFFYKYLFQFYAPPVITSFNPVTATQGNPVTITGTNFNGATSVKFGGVSAATFTVNSNTSITAVLANGATGDVSVTTPGGTATLGGFTYGIVTNVNNVGNNTAKELTVNPNPATDVIMIKHPLSTRNAQLQIIDMHGRVVKTIVAQRNQKQASVSVKELAAGIYQVLWINGSRQLNKPFMIIK